MNKGDRTFHWVGHSKPKEFHINDFFERKHMIDDMEAEINGATNKLQILTIWRWLKRRIFMKPSLQ